MSIEEKLPPLSLVEYADECTPCDAWIVVSTFRLGGHERRINVINSRTLEVREGERESAFKLRARK